MRGLLNHLTSVCKIKSEPIPAETYETVMKKHPERIVEKAIIRMLPKGRLGRQMSKKLHVYVGDNHPHQAQQPVPLEIN